MTPPFATAVDAAPPAAPRALGSATADTTAPDTGDPDFTKKTVSLPTGIEMKYVEAGNPEGDEVVILLH